MRSFKKSKGFKRLIVSLYIFSLLSLEARGAGVLYKMIDLGTIGGDFSRPQYISNAGQVVGWGKNTAGTYRAGFFDATGGFHNIELGTLGGSTSTAYGINNQGVIVGWADNVYGYRRATIFDRTGSGKNKDLGTLGWNSSQAYSINNNGQIVGFAESPYGNRAAIFDPTGSGKNKAISSNFSAANCISDTGYIVGFENDSVSGKGRAALFDTTGGNQTINLDKSGFGRSEAYSVNDYCQIVGYSGITGGQYHATLFDSTGNGSNVDLGTLGGTLSEALSINDAGQIVGWASISSGGMRAALFDATGGGNNINLNDRIENRGDWDFSIAFSINNDGWIVGQGLYNGVGHAVLLEPIPEPGMIALLGLGAALLRSKKAKGKK
jgi:probable HAF family extracellular repeat protein